MKFFGRVAQKAWSPRSQRSLVDQWQLEKQVKNCEQIILYCMEGINELEKQKAWQLGKAGRQQDFSGFYLPATLNALEEKRRELRIYEEHKTSIQSAIEKSKVPDEERAKKQPVLAELASKRLEKDCQMDCALKELRRLLEERAEFTAQMLQVAREIDLTLSEDMFDETRFERFFSLLPIDLAVVSEHWLARFFGDPEDREKYIVQDEIIVLPETLANAGAYRCGDSIKLTKEQAKELLRPRPLGGKPRISLESMATGE